MFEVFCCSSTTAKHTSVWVIRCDGIAHRGAGVFQAWLWLRNSCRSSKATHGQASVCAERRCMADLQSLSSGPHLVVTAQIRMPERISFRLAVLVYRCLHGSAPGYLVSDLRRVSHLNARWRLRSSTTSALVAPRTVFYHWRPHLSSDCCIGLEQFAGVSSIIAVLASFVRQTENRTFCPILQLWLRTSHCTDYCYATSLFRLVVTCPCSLRT